MRGRTLSLECSWCQCLFLTEDGELIPEGGKNTPNTVPTLDRSNGTASQPWALQ